MSKLVSRQGLIVGAALAVTLLDGFDAMSLALVAPPMAKALGLPREALGVVFASVLAGMIGGSVVGGALADRLGRLKVLQASILVFSLAALLMPLASGLSFILVNRVVAGVGLGAAAPIALALATDVAGLKRSDRAVTIIWSGIPTGGVLAAAFAWLALPHWGWSSIFVVGGVAPIVVALLAAVAFKDAARTSTPRAERPGLSVLARRETMGSVLLMAVMFPFGYVTTSLLVNWAPTILNHQGAPQGVISAAFSVINLASVAGALVLGWLSDRLKVSWLLAACWFCAALALVGIVVLGGSLVWLCGLAALASTIAAGAQGLAVAQANRLPAAAGLESTAVGFFISLGRIGQVTALSVSGLALHWGFGERGVMLLGMAGGLVAAAAALALSRMLARERAI